MSILLRGVRPPAPRPAGAGSEQGNLVVEDQPDLVLTPIRPLDIDDPRDRHESESVQAAVLGRTVIDAEIVLANVRRGRTRGGADGIRTLREAEPGSRNG